MSRTLTLAQTGWESIRAIAASGRTTFALKQLSRLLDHPELPATIAIVGNRLAGELALEVGRYASARRYFKIAGALDTTDARTRYLAGRAWEEDPDGCDRRAAICYRKAALLDDTNALYRAAFGRAVSRCGKVRRGVREMLAAADQEPGNMNVIRVVVGGLLEMGKLGDGRQVLAKASFLCPNHREIAALSERIKFETARLIQRQTNKTREYTRNAQDAHFATDGDRVLLPFVRIASETTTNRGAVRTDTISFPRPHLGRLRVGKVKR